VSDALDDGTLLTPAAFAVVFPVLSTDALRASVDNTGT